MLKVVAIWWNLVDISWNFRMDYREWKTPNTNIHKCSSFFFVLLTVHIHRECMAGIMQIRAATLKSKKCYSLTHRWRISQKKMTTIPSNSNSIIIFFLLFCTLHLGLSCCACVGVKTLEIMGRRPKRAHWKSSQSVQTEKKSFLDIRLGHRDKVLVYFTIFQFIGL